MGLHFNPFGILLFYHYSALLVCVSWAFTLGGEQWFSSIKNLVKINKFEDLMQPSQSLLTHGVKKLSISSNDKQLNKTLKRTSLYLCPVCSFYCFKIVLSIFIC